MVVNDLKVEITTQLTDHQFICLGFGVPQNSDPVYGNASRDDQHSETYPLWFLV